MELVRAPAGEVDASVLESSILLLHNVMWMERGVERLLQVGQGAMEGMHLRRLMGHLAASTAVEYQASPETVRCAQHHAHLPFSRLDVGVPGHQESLRRDGTTAEQVGDCAPLGWTGAPLASR